MRDAQLASDYDDFLQLLEEKACGFGMLPCQFWDEEPFDTLIFVEARSDQQRRNDYNVAQITATMNGVNLANMWLKKGQKPHAYPSFYEVYDMDDPDQEQIDPMEARRRQLRAQYAH